MYYYKTKVGAGDIPPKASSHIRRVNAEETSAGGFKYNMKVGHSAGGFKYNMKVGHFRLWETK